MRDAHADWWAQYLQPTSNYPKSPQNIFAACDAGQTNGTGSYGYGRNGLRYIAQITEALRTTGDPALVNELVRWSRELKSNLRDHDGRGYAYFQYGMIDNPSYWWTDTILLEEQLLGGTIALLAWPLHQNRSLNPAAAEEADFWFDYLDRNMVPKWLARTTAYVPPGELGLQNATGWDSPDNPGHTDDHQPSAAGSNFNDVPGVNHQFPVKSFSHTNSAQIFMYKVLGDYFAQTGRPSVFGAAAYQAEADTRDRYWLGKTTLQADGSRNVPHQMHPGIGSPDVDGYFQYTTIYLNALHWVQHGSFASDEAMVSYAKIFYNASAPNNDVYTAGDTTTMAQNINATGSDSFTMMFDSLYMPWDSSGEIRRLNDSAIIDTLHQKIQGSTSQHHGAHYAGILSDEAFAASAQ